MLIITTMCQCKDCKGITLLKGADGRGITSITDNGDGTLTILYTDGTTYVTPDFTGPQGIQGLPGANGTNGINGTNGVGIDVINWLSNSEGQPQGTQGTTDTYRITLTDASTYDFLVTNGANGTGSGMTWITRTNVNSQTYTLPSANLGLVNEYTLNIYSEYTLPATASVGDKVVFVDNKAGGSETRIKPNTGQTIIITDYGSVSAPGRIECPNLTGSLNGTIELVYVSTNKWAVTNYLYLDLSGVLVMPTIVP